MTTVRYALKLRPFVGALVAVHLMSCGEPARGAESVITNGDFQRWTDGVPDGWEVAVGATNGANQPTSTVSSIKGPALMLRGDARTMAWQSVSQEIPAQVGDQYVLEFESRTKDIKREGRQYNNCYVGFISFDQAKKVAGRKAEDVTADSGGWTKHRIEFGVPDNAASTHVNIFLSKSGILGVRNLVVTAKGTTADSNDESSAIPQADARPLVANGDFGRWTDGRPDGWTIDIGARNGGDEPLSEMEPIGKAGLALSGQASTLAWYSLSQDLDLQPGNTYTLSFEAQSAGVRREGRQYDNCYVGLMSFNANGERVEMSTSIKDLSRAPRWQKHRINCTVPANAEKTQLLVFLSKTGTLRIKNVSVKEATPERPFRGSR